MVSHSDGHLAFLDINGKYTVVDINQKKLIHETHICQLLSIQQQTAYVDDIHLG